MLVIDSHIEEHNSAPSLIWNAPSKIQQGRLRVRNEDWASAELWNSARRDSRIWAGGGGIP